MRKTYAYNGILLAILAGIAVWASTENDALALATVIGGSIILFVAIRAIENAIYKGFSKVGDAINNKLDAKHK